MKKTMIYLPEEIHEGLRRLAFEEKTSIAELIRRAVDIAYREDLEDVRRHGGRTCSLSSRARTAMEFEEYSRQRKARVPA